MSKQSETLSLSILIVGVTVGLAAPAGARGWIHPAGFLDVATLQDIKRKSESLDWARQVVEDLDAGVQPWLAQSVERLDALLPKRKMQVYSMLICPECRGGLQFNPFNDQDAACRRCEKTIDLRRRRTTAVPSMKAGDAPIYKG